MGRFGASEWELMITIQTYSDHSDHADIQHLDIWILVEPAIPCSCIVGLDIRSMASGSLDELIDMEAQEVLG